MSDGVWCCTWARIDEYVQLFAGCGGHDSFSVAGHARSRALEMYTFSLAFSPSGFLQCNQNSGRTEMSQPENDKTQPQDVAEDDDEPDEWCVLGMWLGRSTS